MPHQVAEELRTDIEDGVLVLVLPRATDERRHVADETAQAREVVEIAADTADAFFQLAATDRSLAILEESRQRLEDAAASATERYKVGKAGQSDVLQASLEKTSLEEQLSSLRAERRAQAARFNTLQNLPAGDPVPRIGSLAPDFETPAAADLVRRAAERSPAIPLHMVIDQEGDTSRDFARGGVVQFPSSMGLVAGNSPQRAYQVAVCVAKQM